MTNKTIIEFGLLSYLVKNYGDLGGRYLPRPTALLDLHNSS